MCFDINSNSYLCCELKKHNTKTYQELQERIIYIYRERERVITFFLMGDEFKTKIHYPIVKMQERIINPQKGNQKKKKSMRERELSYFGVGNMD